MHFHAGQPFQMYSSHENTPVCKFAENGKKVKPPSVKAPHYFAFFINKEWNNLSSVKSP